MGRGDAAWRGAVRRGAAFGKMEKPALCPPHADPLILPFDVIMASEGPVRGEIYPP